MSHVFGHSSHQGYSLVNTIGVMFKLGLRGLNGIKRGGVWWLKARVHLSSVVSQERPGLIESSAHAPSLSLQPTSTRTRGILRWVSPLKVVNNCCIKLPDEILVVDCIQLKNKATKRLKLTQHQAYRMSTALVQLYTLRVKTNELTARTPNGPRRYSIKLSESQTRAKMYWWKSMNLSYKKEINVGHPVAGCWVFDGRDK